MNSIIKKIYTFFATQAFLTTIALSMPAAVFAQAPPRLDNGNFVQILNTILIQYGFPIATLVAFIMVLVGGYMWMTSGGDAQKVQTAQGTLTWSVIGLVFLWTFRLLIEELFKWLGVA